MMERIQALPRWGRIGVFFLFVVLVIAFFGGLTVFVLYQTVTNTPREEAAAILESEVTVSEFVQLPDEDAYPASLAIDTNGTLYTASYVSGAVWAISPEGDLRELEGTRQALGSVLALETALDGTLYVLDRIDPLESRGAILWRIPPGGTPAQILQLDAEENGRTVLYDDLAADLEGNLYISERILDRVWRLPAGGDSLESWWSPPPLTGADTFEPAGLAYNPARNSLVITDSAINAVYEVPVTSENPAADTEIRYRHTRDSDFPGFDGVAATTEGEIYVAALGLNRVGRLEDGELVYIAGNFRGSSDVAYDAARERLYVNNWDQRSLLPVTLVVINIDIEPHLPFAIDVIAFD